VPVLVVTRFRVADEDGERFLADAGRAVAALAACRGYRSGRVGRAVEDPLAWIVQTEWDGVGAYRRALSAYDVKVNAAPLLGLALDEVSAYEVLLADGLDPFGEGVSARAADADRAAPGRDLS
jgi:Antibiotic biosynthesis monooxygenase